MAKRKTIESLIWGLSLVDNIRDNQFSICKNMFYSKDKSIQTRKWIKTFWNNVWSSPVTSYFYYQHDITQERIAVMFSWWTWYKYDESTDQWNSIKTWLNEFESDWITRPRRSLAVYNNDLYFADWVNPIARYNWTSYVEVTTNLWWVTFTNATDLVNIAWHWLVNWDQIKFTGWTLPAELDLYRVYYVISSLTNTFQISLTYWWTAINFTDDWTWPTDVYQLDQPRVRYLKFTQSRLFWAWEDASPNVLYYTDVKDWTWAATDISANFVLVWENENWIINWIADIWNVLLVWKSEQIYSVSSLLTTPVVSKIDPINWIYWNRCIKNVENSLFYQDDTWIQTLRQRTWVEWWQWLFTVPISDDVRALTNRINNKQLNSGASYYDKIRKNYYYTFDTNNDNIPDTTLVYSTLTWSRTQYSLPNYYDIWKYVNDDWNSLVVIASANWWQMYEIETWYEDNGLIIENQLRTKDYDFNQPWRFKTFEYWDIIWKKSLWQEINVKILVDWNIVVESTITDDYIVSWWSDILPIWKKIIWEESIWWATWTIDDETFFEYLIRVPIIVTWNYIQIDMSSSTKWRWWTLNKIMAWYRDDIIDIFPYSNIW